MHAHTHTQEMVLNRHLHNKDLKLELSSILNIHKTLSDFAGDIK